MYVTKGTFQGQIYLTLSITNNEKTPNNEHYQAKTAALFLHGLPYSETTITCTNSSNLMNRAKKKILISCDFYLSISCPKAWKNEFIKVLPHICNPQHTMNKNRWLKVTWIRGPVWKHLYTKKCLMIGIGIVRINVC